MGVVMIPARIEVRYVEHRDCWKAILVSGARRESVFGSSPVDAVQYLSLLLRISPEAWILRSRSRHRALYDYGSISPTSGLQSMEFESTGSRNAIRAPTRVRHAGALVH